eukprot:XP_011674629.1 PREDICTED: uncharacterized protein LOC105443305 [Strongylocentrotus purpuratus]
MSGLRPPGPLSFDGNVAKNWKDWLRAYEFYEGATELSAKTEPVRYATFLHVAGPMAQQITETLTFTETESGKVSALKTKLAAYCQPKRNLSVIRYLFNSRNQKKGESFSSYITDLKALVKDCEFGELENDLLKDRIVCGIQDQTLREKLLQVQDLNLKKCIDVCSVAENSANEMVELQAACSPGIPAETDYIQRGRRQPQRPRQRYEQSHEQGGRPPKSEASACLNCTYEHRNRACPAINERCRACGEIGHFSKSPRCTEHRNQRRQQSRSRHDNRRRDVEYVDRHCEDDDEPYRDYSDKNMPSQDSDIDMNEFFIDLVVDNVDSDDDWYQEIIIDDDVCVDFKLDSGAQVNILPENIFRKTKLSLDKTPVTLRSYSRHIMKPVGKTRCKVLVGKHEYLLTFQVVGGYGKPLIGRRDCERMNLLKRCEIVDEVASKAAKKTPTLPASTTTQAPANTNSILSANAPPSTDRIPTSPTPNRPQMDPLEIYDDLFAGLGRLRNHEYDITLRNDVNPVKCPPRTIPHKIRDKVRAEIERMEEIGVIERVTEPTDWVSQMTVVHKPDGRVRICLDPRGLNTAIRREHFPMPTFEQVSARMAGARVFSKFDATSGYWQLPLTKASSHYTTFNSPFGRYRYKVMPFGISSASEVWQRAMTDEFGQLDGVEIVADDILVWGKDTVQHDARLSALLEKVG